MIFSFDVRTFSAVEKWEGFRYKSLLWLAARSSLLSSRSLPNKFARERGELDGVSLGIKIYFYVINYFYVPVFFYDGFVDDRAYIVAVLYRRF